MAHPGATTAEADPTAAAVVARWRGGELTREAFRARYDPEEEALTRGGDALDQALCKAVFQEIYSERALALGLGGSPELAAELAAWRERGLVAAWRRAHLPDFSAQAVPERLRAFYAEHAESTYLSTGQADLEVVFLKCGLRAAERSACRERAAALDARLAAGESFAKLVAEQREHGSTASGNFPALPLGGLLTDLAAAVRTAPIGGLTPWIETPHGLFRLQVLSRGVPAPYPYEQVEGQVRLDWTRAQIAAWLAAEGTRLGAPKDAAPEPALASAAIAAGLDRTPAFLVAEANFRRWWLADQAFYLDAQLWPDADRLRDARPTEGEKLARLELLVAKVAVGDDRPAALALAGNLADRLAAAERPLEALAAAPTQLAGVSLETLGPIAREKLRVLPLLHAAVEGLAVGGWRGPVPLPVEQIAPALEARGSAPAKDYRVLAFVAVRALESASDEELRHELMRQRRAEMSTSVAAFLAEMGARWQIELLPSPASR